MTTAKKTASDDEALGQRRPHRDAAPGAADPPPRPGRGGVDRRGGGGSGITVHLRMDRRHIQDADVERLREGVRGKLNLEMSISAEMLKAALRLRPHQVTLVPERPEEVTTEGGLNLIFYGRRDRRGVRAARRRGHRGVGLHRSRARASSRRSPACPAAARAGSKGSRSTPTPTPAPGTRRRPRRSWPRSWRWPRPAGRRGCRVYAGHGLRTDNVGPVAAIPQIEELNIGHALVARSVMIGLEAAVREMLAAMKG